MLKKLEMIINDNVVLTLCFDITIYLRHSFHDSRDGVIHFYREAMNIIGNDVRWYYTETMGPAKQITPKVLEMIPSWFAPGAKTREIYQMTLRAGSNADEIAPIRFGLFSSDTRPGESPSNDPSSDTGIMRLTLQPEVVSHPDRLVELAKKLVGSLPFVSGHAGFGLVWEEKEMDDAVLRRIRTWARKHPGLDVFGFLSVENFVIRGIKCVNWLTLINNASVSKLGGLASLKRQFDPPIILHKLPGGLMIQAGNTPELGDVNRNQNLPLYRHVGRVLNSIREHPDPDEIYPFVGDEASTLEWLARFDE